VKPTEAEAPEDQPGVGVDRQAEAIIAACDEVRALLATYTNVAKAVADGYFLDAKKHLGKEKSLTPKLVSALAKLSDAVNTQTLETVVLDRARSEQLHYRENLEERLAAANIKFTGEFPDYTVAEIIRLQIDLQKGNSHLDGKRLGTLEPVRVVGQLSERISELLDRDFDGGDFLRALISAYDETLSAQGRGYGEYADVRTIGKAVGDKLKQANQDANYSEKKFAVDLYRLCVSGRPATPEGATLEFSPAQSASGGLYVPAKTGGNYIAALRFVKGADHA